MTAEDLRKIFEKETGRIIGTPNANEGRAVWTDGYHRWLESRLLSQRSEIIEECAKVCEGIPDSEFPHGKAASFDLHAAAIRSLKGKQNE